MAKRTASKPSVKGRKEGMMKVLYIDWCWECNHCQNLYVDIFECIHPEAPKGAPEANALPVDWHIPEWCPLPDKED